MVLITLVGTPIARVDAEFIYTGPSQECKDCRIKTVCLNLQIGKRYRVTAVRDKTHKCSLNAGTAQIVEVDKAQDDVAVPARLAMEASTITFERAGCKTPDCQHYRLCNPAFLGDGSKLKILKAKGKLSCPKGLQQVRVTVI